MRGLLALILLWSGSVSAATQKEKLKPLEFTAEKNNVQILSQRFEYALIDAEKLRIGDILIDAAKMTFAVESSKEGYRLRFQWPAALVADGTVSVLNNNGKAVWSSPFNEKSVKIATDKTVEDEDIRSEIANYESEPVEKSIVDELKFLPFLNFCVSKETERTKIYLCSRDLFVKVEPNGSVQIHNRATAKKESLVEINNKQATNQGLIYLNDASEDLSLRGQSESGASLEIITRKRDIDFYDVTLSTDGKSLLIRARGAQPARKKGVRRINDEEYEVTLPKGRPYYYILGEGGIPMRQEFFIRGTVPTEDARPYLSANTPDRTYSASLDLLGVHPANVKVDVSEKETSSVTAQPKNRFTWSWWDLKSGANNRRYLKVASEKGQFVGSYEIYRGRPNVINLDVVETTPNGIPVASLEYQRWFGSFLGEFRTGMGLEYATNLSKKDDVADTQMTTLAFRYRFTPGFALRDPSSALGLFFTQFNFAGFTSVAPGLELYKEMNFESFGFMPWWTARLRFWSASSGSDVKLASGYRVSFEGLTNVSPDSRFAFRGLLGASQFKIDGADDAKMQIELGLGMNLRF